MMALKEHIGRICHVYLDDIVIWSQSYKEHEVNVGLVLSALRKASLFCSAKKTHLFCTKIDFLGHHISAQSIEADQSKIQKILDWPRPCMSTEVQRFLGLVRYISTFLPRLAEFTLILSPLMKKECNSLFPAWTRTHQDVFDEVKCLVLSRECLTTIDHTNPGDNKIFVTCDASKRRIGSVLSFGPSWETARPVAFESHAMQGAELRYSVHEQELLSIIHSLRKWHSDLLGSKIEVFTDHRTLENFGTQRELSA